MRCCWLRARRLRLAGGPQCREIVAARGEFRNQVGEFGVPRLAPAGQPRPPARDVHPGNRTSADALRLLTQRLSRDICAVEEFAESSAWVVLVGGRATFRWARGARALCKPATSNGRDGRRDRRSLVGAGDRAGMVRAPVTPADRAPHHRPPALSSPITGGTVAGGSPSSSFPWRLRWDPEAGCERWRRTGGRVRPTLPVRVGGVGQGGVRRWGRGGGGASSAPSAGGNTFLGLPRSSVPWSVVRR
ncbi:Uncharacterised protein [Nocardia farcinica]|uniref:Uncharacterized protein n=1 Tax=Nocardia farcinica TaxID=37329 RepID=A0A449GIU7_NOCFR|nr:Uncharacterised protein [Nocardia farcinica]